MDVWRNNCFITCRDIPSPQINTRYQSVECRPPGVPPSRTVVRRVPTGWRPPPASLVVERGSPLQTQQTSTTWKADGLRFIRPPTSLSGWRGRGCCCWRANSLTDSKCALRPYRRSFGLDASDTPFASLSYCLALVKDVSLCAALDAIAVKGE